MECLSDTLSSALTIFLSSKAKSANCFLFISLPPTLLQYLLTAGTSYYNVDHFMYKKSRVDHLLTIGLG